ncbi:glycosyl hydrolase family 18 protein [Dysgonomonas sp. 511]|uniref:glycosyl hydrolase family 18 protein n=1 Tax=Dysgonomonas sp. 511 TaxID=2302930 RepID=UPI0013D36DF5|nr:glycosyl hydrolase family 18 protein [Dysgonomonas sp. 511]NDV78719.1 hypothetical protein [Dysgonomonas sp. 511]
MKTLKYILFVILPLFAFISCENDDGDNPGFADDEVPRIYMDWQQYLTRNVGDVITLSPMVSPSDGATYKWTLDGEVISTEKDFSYTITQKMVGLLKFEVTRKEASNSREGYILVPNDFAPKAYNKKSVAFLTGNGSIGDVDWDNITHLIVSSAVVEEDGSLNMSNINGLNLSVLTTYAHHHGVSVLLEVSGILNSYLNAAPVYQSYTFYDNAVGSKYKSLADNIVEQVKAHNLDGINVYMDKANTANGLFAESAKLRDFYLYLANEMKSGKNVLNEVEHDYIMTMSVVAGWTRGSLYTVAGLTEYDWINVLAFAIEDLDAVPHSSQWAAENEIAQWMTTWIGPIPANRLVLGVPTFGVHFSGKPADYTWGNWGSFNTYVSYKAICSKYPDAPAKNGIIIKDNDGDKSKEVDKIYYDGPPAIRAKAAFALTKDLAGMALWSIENDSKDPAASLIKQMNTSLGN